VCDLKGSRDGHRAGGQLLYETPFRKEEKLRTSRNAVSGARAAPQSTRRTEHAQDHHERVRKRYELTRHIEVRLLTKGPAKVIEMPAGAGKPRTGKSHDGVDH
jgi:hypothetical protein